MYIQRGIGRSLARRLRSVGINLSDQGINQKLAREGSATGSLATIDLSSASDTVASKLVEILLPEEWYRAMNISRSHFGTLASGELIHYQKFSSMGNGFTFELESLIFWALSSACMQYLGTKDRRLGVYGDDIIVPTSVVPLLLRVLKVSGFSPNAKKTWYDGPFRESCGKHYFNGEDVSPFYLRKKLDCTQPMFTFMNNLRRWIARDGMIRPSDWALYQGLVKQIPRFFRTFGPDGYGDNFLIGNFEEALPQRAKRGWEGWHVRSILRVDSPPARKSERVDGVALIPKSLYRLRDEFQERQVEVKVAYSDEVTTRLRQPYYREKRLLVVQWPSAGYPLV
jgi:hypothetical protein